jgi:hypothetical protein
MILKEFHEKVSELYSQWISECGEENFVAAAFGHLIEELNIAMEFKTSGKEDPGVRVDGGVPSQAFLDTINSIEEALAKAKRERA